jgi:hypothetical protein
MIWISHKQEHWEGKTLTTTIEKTTLNKKNFNVKWELRSKHDVLNKILGKNETQQARIYKFERKTHIYVREKLPYDILKMHGCHNFWPVILNNNTLL